MLFCHFRHILTFDLCEWHRWQENFWVNDLFVQGVSTSVRSGVLSPRPAYIFLRPVLFHNTVSLYMEEKLFDIRKRALLSWSGFGSTCCIQQTVDSQIVK
jgi:hypothetical protein